jgi:hypothetical protein
MKLHYSSELMKNQKHALLMPPDSQFEAIRTKNGCALFFSIGSDQVLYCISETPGSKEGWTKTNLLTSLTAGGKKMVAKAFSVSENAGTNRVSMALAVTDGATDLLYLSLNNDNTNASWCSTITWTLMAYDDIKHDRPKVVISNVFIKQSASGEFIVADVLRDPAQDFIFRYYIDPSKQVTGSCWNAHDVAIDLQAGKIKSSLGRKQGERIDGMYTLGDTAGRLQLTYAPLYNRFNPAIAPKPTLLTLPPKTTTIATATVSDDRTDLYLAAGNGIYYLPHDQQTSTGTPHLLVEHPVLEHISTLHADTSGSEVYVWGLNTRGEVFYISCARGRELEPGAWSSPVPILTGSSQVATFLNVEHKSCVIFSNMSGKKLIQLSRDPASSMWQRREILLPPADVDQVIEVNTYTTHIRVTDDSGLPVEEAIPFHITATGSCSVYINNEYRLIGQAIPLAITPDAAGTITILQEVNSLGAICYHVSSGEVKLDINPMKALVGTLSGVKTADALGKVQIKQADGSQRALIPANTPEHEVQATAGSLARFTEMAQQMPPDGSVRPPSTKLLRSNRQLLQTALQNTDTLWGVTYDDSGWQYHDGHSLLNHFRQTNNLLLTDDGQSLVLTGYNNIFSSFAGDIFNWLKDCYNKVSQFIVTLVDDAYHCFITIAGQVYRFVIDSINAVLQGVEFIFNKIKVFFEDLIKWLGFLFQWKDILRTKDVLKNIIRVSINKGIDDLGSAKTGIRQTFGAVRQRLNEWAGLPPVPGNLSAGVAAAGPVPGEDTPQANWGNYHMQNGADKAVVDTKMVRDANAPLEEMLKALAARLAEQGEIFKKAYDTLNSQIIGKLGTLSADDIVKRIVVVIGDILISSTENILIGAIDVIIIMVQGLFDLLDAPVEIPVISWIYKLITGNRLTLLDASCLVIAIPATIVYKVAMNEAPFPNNDLTKAIINAQSFKQLQQLLNPSTDNEVAGLEIAPKQTLVKTARMVAGCSSFLLIALNILKRAAPKNKACSTLYGIFSITTRLQAYVNMLYAQNNPKWVTEINIILFSLTITQKAALLYAIEAGTEEGLFEVVDGAVEMTVGLLSMAPAIKTIADKQDRETVIDFIGNTCWNVSRMLTPFEKSPPAFVAKMAGIGLYGVSQWAIVDAS